MAAETNDNYEASHVKHSRDDWRCIKSSRERRTLQNRLAQRAWRQRQSLLASVAARESMQPIPTIEPYRKQGQSVLRFSTKKPKQKEDRDDSAILGNRMIKPENCRQMDLSISPDYKLLTVVQNNVLRGLLSNILSLQLTQLQITQEDSISTFCLQSDVHWRTTHVPLPPSLEPTSLQLTVAHHPWVDILPCPKLRDSILNSLQGMPDEIETELCQDIVGAGKLQQTGSGPGLLLWGDAFDIRNWEVSEAILEKWFGIFKDCTILLESSKSRRRQRGF